MADTLLRRRQAANVVALVLSVVSTVLGLACLVWILQTTLVNGIEALGLNLFTKMTPPPGESGGLLNAFFGSFLMIVIAVVTGTPIGIAAGTWLAEYGKSSKFADLVRFVNDILLSAPSIIIGLFVYTVVVRPSGHFSGWAGGISLAFILLPVVVRTTDEMLRLIPSTMREAALALGIPQWKITVQILYRAARSGIVTGILLAVARISGETAPLLFTALNNQYWTANPAGPMANIPVVIFQYSMSPYEAWHTLAWGGAFVMTVFVLLLNLTTRGLLGQRRQSND